MNVAYVDWKTIEPPEAVDKVVFEGYDRGI